MTPLRSSSVSAARTRRLAYSRGRSSSSREPDRRGAQSRRAHERELAAAGPRRSFLDAAGAAGVGRVAVRCLRHGGHAVDAWAETGTDGGGGDNGGVGAVGAGGDEGGVVGV